MDLFFLLFVGLIAAHWAKSQQQRQRILLLGRHLHPYQIEKHMEHLIQGYLRAMGEAQVERRAQVLATLEATEQQLHAQFERFVDDFRRLPAEQTRVSRLPLALPFALQLFPQATFDMREALAIHGRGIARALNNEEGLGPRDRAYVMVAELLLMQHSCHWFCQSFIVANGRVLARHQTDYRQIVHAVSPATRRAYQALIKMEIPKLEQP